MTDAKERRPHESLSGMELGGETLDELQANLQDVVSMLLEDGEPKFESEFSVGNLLALKPREVPARRSPSFP